MNTKRLHGQALKQAILLSRFLGDHPKRFRRRQVTLALLEDGIEAASSTLDNVLKKLIQQGYLERSPDLTEPDIQKRWYWYRFARSDRTSERPGFRPGEKGDVMLWKPGEEA